MARWFVTQIVVIAVAFTLARWAKSLDVPFMFATTATTLAFCLGMWVGRRK